MIEEESNVHSMGRIDYKIMFPNVYDKIEARVMNCSEYKDGKIIRRTSVKDILDEFLEHGDNMLSLANETRRGFSTLELFKSTLSRNEDSSKEKKENVDYSTQWELLRYIEEYIKFTKFLRQKNLKNINRMTSVLEDSSEVIITKKAFAIKMQSKKH